MMRYYLYSCFSHREEIYGANCYVGRTHWILLAAMNQCQQMCTLEHVICLQFQIKVDGAHIICVVLFYLQRAGCQVVCLTEPEKA